MKAAQIKKYSKKITAEVNDIPIPQIGDHEVLVKVKVAAVNPLEMLIITGSVKMIQNYEFPLTLGNELTGVIEKIGKKVEGFKVGDAIYSRLPLTKIGAFVEYAAIDASAIGHLPANLDFVTGAAAPLTGLTAYQGLHEELEAKAGETVFILGGSGSFGQMAIPIAKAMGLKVIVSGSPEARERIIEIGADQYLDYTTEKYWEVLSSIDYVIDTLGPAEFDHELSIIKPGGRLLSLRTGPNKRFAENHGFPGWKQKLFAIAGAKYDRKAKKKGIQFIEKDTVHNGEKLGTYGVIKGAKTFLGVSVKKSEYGLIAAGYQFENLILYATDMGLGTVWLAATFSRDQFATAMDIKEDELFPAISPIGYAAGKKSITESLMRKTMKSDRRKPWEEIFFRDSFENQLSKEEANQYVNPLEMLRLAPSATNAQPWRVVKKQGAYHFFETHKSSASEEEVMIKKVDLGIALSHFHQTVLENGLTGNFEKQSDFKIDIPDHTNYIISWKIDEK